MGVMLLNWTDPALKWDSSSFDNLFALTIDPSDIWKPLMFLVNVADNMEPIGHGVTFYTTLTSTGDVYYSPGGIMKAKCPTNVAKFPFDTQECNLMFISWGISNTTLTLSALSNQARLYWYTPNSDWTLLEYSTFVEFYNEYSTFNVKIKIKRQSLYYAVMMILPTLLFALLNPLVFVIPVESGERVSLAMTILLSYAIFLTLVSAAIPTSSNPICVLLAVMITIISLSGLIVGSVIMVSKYYFEETTAGLSSPLKRLAKWRLEKKRNVVLPINDPKKQINEIEVNVTGKDVANALDCVCLCIFYAAILVCLTGYFVYVLI
ncbi:acetylcholine receptor subunit beta-type acr-3-like [Mytilus trossulus]|uniref:acetylcholine receptor subunit beta-type acr-3-like n=1 Tax=Mytilus trossulus TaxID=6551 RepID=UPI0030052374